MYPSRYNDEHEMARYFAFRFIDSTEIDSFAGREDGAENVKADGIIYGIIPHDEAETDGLAEKVRSCSAGHKRFIFVLPRHYRDIDSAAREYDAVSLLRDEASDDSVLFDEYGVIFEDMQEIIRSFISSYTRPEESASVYIHDGEILKIHRKAELAELMSSICDEVYSLTPVIINEALNKNDITSIAASSRNKIISGLLRAELEKNLGLSGSGQEVSIMRSTLIRTGILQETGGTAGINLHPDDSRMSSMLGTIENFIIEARHSGRVNFGALYERLTSPEHHIGLRLGLVSVYLAAVIHEYRQQVIIADTSGQIPVSAELL